MTRREFYEAWALVRQNIKQRPLLSGTEVEVSWFPMDGSLVLVRDRKGRQRGVHMIPIDTARPIGDGWQFTVAAEIESAIRFAVGQSQFLPRNSRVRVDRAMIGGVW
ncbi:MAG: hypothetical protein KC613_03735 [Myxococcales bacterium]|nr:hypothetical protein [Myxococcales bacterium]